MAPFENGVDCTAQQELEVTTRNLVSNCPFGRFKIGSEGLKSGTPAMPLIFLLYRRADTKWMIGRICDRLASRFGMASIFFDIDTIPLGLNFQEHIESILQRCDIVLAVIGPRWLGSNEVGQGRIFDENDWVRIEIETALRRNIPIVPVLIDNEPMPAAEKLPPGLRSLASIQAAQLDSGRDFNVHMTRIIRAVEQRISSRSSVPRYVALAVIVASILCLTAIYAFRGSFLKTSIPESDNAQSAIQACNIEFALPCAQEGGAFGSSEALAGLRNCKNAELVVSDEPLLHWKDIWTTSVYSYAPGGGGPGGGLDDDVLKVGGWGDWYFSLIEFNLPSMQHRPKFAAVALYSRASEGASVPLEVDRIIQRWDFPKGDRLWWKDRPGGRAMTTESLPAPKKEQWYVVDLSPLVQEWLDGKSENYGIQIRPVSNYGSFVFFVSSDAPDKNRIPRLIFCA